MRSFLPAALAALMLLVPACQDGPPTAADMAEADLALHSDHTAHSAHAADAVAPLDRRALAEVRRGTAQYQQFERAVADGFVPLSPCVASPAGGMGVHYGNPARLGAISVVPSQPEILLYEPTANGRMRLVGVEYAVHGGAWYAAGNEGPPRLAGRDFDPPNPNHPDEAIRELYTLHVWVWRDNPSGMFAHFNPRVSCEH